MDKLYVLPDRHRMGRGYMAKKAAEVFSMALKVKKLGKEGTVSLRTETGELYLDSATIRGWQDYPATLKEISREAGVGTYRKNAKLIRAAKPDVLFLEEADCFREPVFDNLERLDSEAVAALTYQDKNVFASHMPVYDACKKAGIRIIPVDNEELMEKIMNLEKEAKEAGKSADATKKDFFSLVRQRSEYMLNNIRKEMAEGSELVYLAMVGPAHYKNFKKLAGKLDPPIEIRHIDERLKELGVE
jgi:hypothetical protein